MTEATAPAPPPRPRRSRILRRLGLGILGALAAAAALGAIWQATSERRDLAAHPAPGRLVDVGGYRLHLHCLGAGSPTVILEAGLGNDVNHWRRVQPALAAETRTCAYDRAGLGWSDPGPLPRTPARVVTELSRLLDAAGERPPFVLVGHSNGGPYVRLLAASRPADVRGLVLVDPNTEFIDPCPVLPLPMQAVYGSLVALAPVGVPRLAFPWLFPPERLPLVPEGRAAHAALRARTGALGALWSEWQATCDLLAAVRTAAPLPDALPMVLVAAGRRPAQQDARIPEFYRQTVARWPGAELVLAERSGHWVQHDQPELVIDAVRRVMARGGR